VPRTGRIVSSTLGILNLDDLVVPDGGSDSIAVRRPPSPTRTNGQWTVLSDDDRAPFISVSGLSAVTADNEELPVGGGDATQEWEVLPVVTDEVNHVATSVNGGRNRTMHVGTGHLP